MTTDINRWSSLVARASGQPFESWPAWSIGETLAVALILNRADVLDAMSFTLVEAFDRVDLSVSELRAIERKLQNGEFDTVATVTVDAEEMPRR